MAHFRPPIAGAEMALLLWLIRASPDVKGDSLGHYLWCFVPDLALVSKGRCAANIIPVSL
jgi:hypothetical protein